MLKIERLRETMTTLTTVATSTFLLKKRLLTLRSLKNVATPGNICLFSGEHPVCKMFVIINKINKTAVCVFISNDI